MRRTRYFALPVRAWQYVGLLVVSLACLTVGLVSRDKEGRAGSLAGPELEHRAPHEVDACPNSSPFAKMPSCLDIQQEQSIVSRTTREARDSTISRTTADLKTPRSRSVERVSRSRLQYRADFRSTETLDRRAKSVRNDFSRRTMESNLRTSGQSRTRRLSNPENRLSRSFRSRFTDDLPSERSIERSADSNRRREINKRENESRERRTQVTIVRDTSLDQHRRSLPTMDRRDLTDERRERVNRLDRHRNIRSNERRDSSFRSLKRSADLDRRERSNRVVRMFETSKNDLLRQRVREMSDDRRSRDRRALVDSTGRASERRSTSVESRNREEASADRRHVDQRINRRLTEQRMSERAKEQRADRRLAERTANDRRAEQRDDRRLKEQRAERRLADRGEIRSDRLKERRAARRLTDQRGSQRLMERRSERRATEERNDRRGTSDRRSLAQRFNANRLQRTRIASVIPANDIRFEENGKRLINRIQDQQTSFRGRVLNDARRSRSTDREYVHSANRLSRTRSIHRDLLEDSTSIREHVKLPQSLDQRRNSRVSTDTRSGSLATRDNVSSRSNDFLARTRSLKEENSTKHAAALEAIRQAFVIGLCTVYGLTIYYGKRSFINNFVARVPRFIVW